MPQKPPSARRHRRRLLVVAAALAAFLSLAGIGIAALDTGNYMRADAGATASPLDIYDYSSASSVAWTSQAEFGAGTLVDASADAVPGSVTLAPVGPAGTGQPDLFATPWWDSAWQTRRCYDIDHTSAAASPVSEYQLRLDLDLAALVAGGFLQADFGDLRAVAADGTTQLDLWVEDDRTLWVQVDSIPAAAVTEFCLYFGHDAGPVAPLANHTEEAVFSYTTPQPIYYAVGRTQGGGQQYAATVEVVSYTDGNQVRRNGGGPVALDDGDRTTFAGTNAGDVFSVLGPLSTRVVGDRRDVVMPVSWAGTAFVVPTGRSTQRFAFFAPFGDAAVSIYNGGAAAPYATFVVAGGTHLSHNAGDVGSVAIIESDVPVLVTHVTTNNRDSIGAYPATAEDLLGIARGRFSVLNDGSLLTVHRSNAADVNWPTNNRGQLRTVNGSGQGAGPGFLIKASGPHGGIAQADGDGVESVVFLPPSELNSRYWIPESIQYVAASCPGTGIALEVEDPGGTVDPLTCTGTSSLVSHARLFKNVNATAGRGIEIRAVDGEPFYAYYEQRANGDETNLLGPKQGRQYTWPEPAAAPRGYEGQFPASGTWESTTFDTAAGSEVFGRLGWMTAEPAGTTVRLQVATADADPPTSFVGPDGTVATSFTTLPAVLDFAHDGDRYVRVKAWLETTDPFTSPQLDHVAVDYHLARLARPLASSPTVAVVADAGPATHYLLRVRTDDPTLAGSTARLLYRRGTNLANIDSAVLSTERAAAPPLAVTQLTLAGGPPVLAVGLDVVFPGPHSVVLAEDMAASGVTTVDVTWQLNLVGSASIYVESDFTLEVTVP